MEQGPTSAPRRMRLGEAQPGRCAVFSRDIRLATAMRVEMCLKPRSSQSSLSLGFTHEGFRQAVKLKVDP